ncbi:hypothetical protein V6C27_07155 [Peptococcaceae bacterium 1198_IL3148]
MMKDKTIPLLLVASVLVLTMGLDSANVLAVIADKGFLIAREHLLDALYLIIGILSWMGFKRSGNGFFKWMFAFAVINIILSFESTLFRQLVQQLYNTQSYSDYTSTIYVITNIIASALNIALHIIIALLPIYAISNYDDKLKFLDVFKPRMLMAIILFWAFLTIYISVMHFQQVPALSKSYLIFVVANSAGFIAIAIYGVKKSLDKYRVHNCQLFKWLMAYFATNVIFQILVLAINIKFIILGEMSNFTYLMLIYAAPLLLIIALLKHREEAAD